MWTFLTGANLTMWTRDLDDTSKIIFADNPRLMALKALHDALKPTPLFRTGTWLLLNAAVCLFAWRRRNTSAGAFALGVCGSAIVYMMTFFAVGVATDFRYAYWAVLAGLTGAIAVAQRRDETLSF
jgi:peptidoglycan/LPS O-acetylase OafA/YrhL